MATQFWHVRNCSLFRLAPAEEVERLERFARVRRFPRGSAVYTPADAADGVFLLAEGRIRLGSVTPDGKQAILAFVEPGELFGEMALIVEGSREERAEAVVDSLVALVPASEVRSLMERCAALAVGVTKLCGLRRLRLERRLRSLLFRSNRERLAHLLWDLAEQYGEPTSDGIALRIRLSHQDLASLVGATRETVTATLGEMQLAGLIQVGRLRIVVRQPDALAAELGLPPRRSRFVAGAPPRADFRRDAPPLTEAGS